MDLNEENTKKIKKLIFYTIAIFVALWNYKVLYGGIRFLGHVIFPFALGGAIAFILNVPMCFLEETLFRNRKQKATRILSFILTVFFVAGIIGIVVFVAVPELGNTVLHIGKTLQEIIPKIQNWAEKLFEDNPEIAMQIQKLDFEWDKLLGRLVDFLKNGTGSALDTTVAAAKSIVNGVTTFFIALVFSCYILLQKEKLTVQVQKLMYAFLPRDWTEIFIALGSVAYKTFSNFLTGQCLEAVILGSMFFVTMLILRLPYSLLISVLIAFTALIPIVGTLIACAVGTLLIFIINPTQALVFIILFLVLQQIEGNFIYPHVVGNSVGLPSIWVLVAVSMGASFMGVVGILVFIPIVSVVYTLLRGIVNRRLKEKNISI